MGWKIPDRQNYQSTARARGASKESVQAFLERFRLAFAVVWFLSLPSFKRPVYSLCFRAWCSVVLTLCTYVRPFDVLSHDVLTTPCPARKPCSL